MMTCYNNILIFYIGQYCMPANGVDLTAKDQLLSSSEIIKIASIFVQEGVNKIRLTGGEPSIRPDIVELVGKFKIVQQWIMQKLF